MEPDRHPGKEVNVEQVDRVVAFDRAQATQFLATANAGLTRLQRLLFLALLCLLISGVVLVLLAYGRMIAPLRNTLTESRAVLRKYLPQDGKKDLRGWEWRYAWEQCRSDELFSLNGHSNIVTCLALSRTGDLIASGSYDNTVKLWDLKSKKLLKTLAQNSAVRGVAFSRDGKELIVGNQVGGVTFWNCSTWQRTATLSNLSVRALTVSPQDNTLAVVGTAFVTLWDLATRQQISRFSIRGHALLAGIAFSPDLALLAYGTGDGAIALWDRGAATIVAELKATNGRIRLTQQSTQTY
jgi:WD40 repeat protein